MTQGCPFAGRPGIRNEVLGIPRPHSTVHRAQHCQKRPVVVVVVWEAHTYGCSHVLRVEHVYSLERRQNPQAVCYTIYAIVDFSNAKTYVGRTEKRPYKRFQQRFYKYIHLVRAMRRKIERTLVIQFDILLLLLPPVPPHLIFTPAKHYNVFGANKKTNT